MKKTALTPTLRNAYHARDVVNAPTIKQHIQRRSAERGDAADVAAWLSNHFYRYVVGNLQADEPALRRITNTQQLQELAGFQAPASWALERLASDALSELWWIQPDSPAVLAMETRLVEFLSTRKGTSLEGKLQRINCPQALARWTLEHLAFEKKQNSGWVEHSKQAVQGLLRDQHGTFVEFDRKSPYLRQEMAYESQMMGHCVGQFTNRKCFSGGYGEHYATGLESGRMRLFSYRTGLAQPRITVNAYVKANGLLQIEQIKGKQNRPPIARYAADVVSLLNHLPLNDEVPEDALVMGIVRRPPEVLQTNPELATWCTVQELRTDNEQMWLMQQHPRLLPQLNLQSPLMQWMVATRKDAFSHEALDRIPLSAALQQTLLLAKQRSARA
ncbi:MAG: hypothetical protein KBF33_13395 [Comamonas sp.]|nr:hypothetical protein [Comamonas sp.]